MYFKKKIKERSKTKKRKTEPAMITRVGRILGIKSPESTEEHLTTVYRKTAMPLSKGARCSTSHQRELLLCSCKILRNESKGMYESSKRLNKRKSQVHNMY